MAFRLLDGATSTGASATHVTLRQGCDDHTVHVSFTGGPSAVTVDLEGSVINTDQDNWEQLATHSASAAELTAGSFMFHVANKNTRFIRLNLTTLSGGTSPTVTGLYEPLDL